MSVWATCMNLYVQNRWNTPALLVIADVLACLATVVRPGLITQTGFHFMTAKPKQDEKYCSDGEEPKTIGTG